MNKYTLKTPSDNIVSISFTDGKFKVSCDKRHLNSFYKKVFESTCSFPETLNDLAVAIENLVRIHGFRVIDNEKI